jgi:hypothetical protein
MNQAWLKAPDMALNQLKFFSQADYCGKLCAKRKRKDVFCDSDEQLRCGSPKKRGSLFKIRAANAVKIVRIHPPFPSKRKAEGTAKEEKKQETQMQEARKKNRKLVKSTNLHLMFPE